ADAFAGLAVVEIAKVGVALDPLAEEVVERAFPLIEIEPEKRGVLEQVAAEWDGAEIDVHGTGEILPSESAGIELGGEFLQRFRIVRRDGERGPCLAFVGFAVLEIGDVEALETGIEQFQ